MHHFFKIGVIKRGELLSIFQKKQKNEFLCVKLVITLIFYNEKVPFIDFLSKSKYITTLLLIVKPVFWEISLIKKVIC